MMQLLDSLFAVLGLSKASVVTGGIGAAAAAFNGDKRPWYVRVINFTVGFMVAAWGASIVVTVFHLPDTPTFNGALGFVLGYLGMTLMDAVMVAAVSLKTIGWSEIISSWLTKK